MTNYEFYLRNKIDDYELRDALASLLQLVEADVKIVDDITELTGDTTPAIVEREYLGGEFACFLSVYLKTGITTLSEMEFVTQLSSKLASAVLYAKDDPNPYLWILVANDGKHIDVLLQDEPLDERGEAIVSRTNQTGQGVPE